MNFRTCMISFFFLLALTAAYLFTREPSRPRAGVAAIAGLLPRETQVLMACDVRSEVDLKQAASRLKELLKEVPEASSGVGEAEDELGASLEECASWFAPAGFLALFPLEGESGLVPSSRDSRPLEMVAGVAVVQEARVAELLERARAKSGSPAPKVQVIGGVPFQMAEVGSGETVGFGFYGGYLVMGTSPKALEKLTARDGRLRDEGQFRDCLARLEVGSGAVGYFSMRPTTQGALNAPEVGSYVDDQTRQGLESLELAALGLDVRRGEARVTGWLKVDSGSSSPFAQALLGPSEVTGDGARFVPADWAMYNAFNLQYAWNVLMRAVELSPQARGQVGAVPVEITAATGVALDDLWKATTGEIGCSTNLLQALPQAAAAGNLQKPPLTCVLVTVSLRDVARTRELLEKLYAKVPQRPSVVKTVDGVEILAVPESAPDDSVHFCLVESGSPCLVLAAGVDSLGVLEKALAVSQDPSASVAGRAVFRQGLKDSGGRNLAMFDYSNWDGLVDALRQADLPDERASELLKSWLGEIPSLEGTSFVRVEEDGLYFKSRGGGSTTLLAGTTGILAAILVPNFVRARGQGQLTACKSNLKNLGTGLEMYCTDYSGNYPRGLQDLTPNYLRTIPTCPGGGQYTYAGGGPDRYTMVCVGAAHSGSGIPENFPQYTSVQGLIERP